MSPSKVDFYVLNQPSGLKSLHFACKLVEKSYTEQKHIYVHTDSREDAERFDALLWTFNDISFIPHAIMPNAAPIQIGFDAPTHTHQDMLVNLTRTIPDFYKQFKQVIEIVFSDPLVQQLARERFRAYRDQGCEINTYKISEV